MAEKPKNQSKRRVRNPDTFRERAVKAAETSEKSGRVRRVKQGAAKPFRPMARAVKKSLAVKILGKVWRIVSRIMRFIVPPYFRNSWQELKLVAWPNWKQSRALTGAVLIFAIVFGASVALVDYGLDKLFRNILLK